MKEQRDKLIAIKKAEREKKVQEEEDRKKRSGGGVEGNIEKHVEGML
jgi:hypothetical protein